MAAQIKSPLLIIPRPVPKADEILVQVHAAGLNPIDNMISKGTFKPIIRLATAVHPLAAIWRVQLVEVGSRVTAIQGRRFCIR